MTAFLDDITPFLGENKRNEAGQTLSEFLEAYDSQKYQNPSLTADVMAVWAEKGAVTVNDGLKILLICRKNHPSIGWWALPGGFVDYRENSMDAAKRELFEETGLKDVPMEQFAVWGEYNRDPRTRIVTITHLSYFEKKPMVKAGDDAEDADWFKVSFHEICTREEKVRTIKVYELVLTGERTKEVVTAQVEYSYQTQGILREENFRVLSHERLAFDHPSAITKGLLLLEERLRHCK